MNLAQWKGELRRSMREKAWNEQGVLGREVSDLPGDYWKGPAWADVVGLKVKLMEEVSIVDQDGRLGVCCVAAGGSGETLAPVMRGDALWRPGEAFMEMRGDGGLPEDVAADLVNAAWGEGCLPWRWLAPLSVGLGREKGKLMEIPEELCDGCVTNDGYDPLRQLMVGGNCGHCGTIIMERGVLEYRETLDKATFELGPNGDIELGGEYPELNDKEMELVQSVMELDPDTEWKVGLWNIKGHGKEMLKAANEKCWIVKSKYVIFIVTKANHLSEILLGEMGIRECVYIVDNMLIDSDCKVQTKKNIGGIFSIISMKYLDYKTYLRNRVVSMKLKDPQKGA